MTGSDGKQTSVLGRLRSKRDSRRQRRAEKARVKGEAKREWERSGEVDRPRAGYGGGPGAGGV